MYGPDEVIIRCYSMAPLVCVSDPDVLATAPQLYAQGSVSRM
jgi:hypothetical protein